MFGRDRNDDDREERREYGGNDREERRGYAGGEQQGYGQQEQGYGRQEQGYGQQEQGYGRQDQGYGEESRGYGGDNDRGSYGGDERRQDYGGNMTHGGGYPAGAGVPQDDDDDYRNAAETASRAAGDSGDSSFFSGILGSLTQKKSQINKDDIDEDEAVRSHKSFFGSDPEPQSASPKSMGMASAMQALKMFNSGSGQGTSQSSFVALAMAEASKLFDQQSSKGNVQDGASKESAVMQAGETALKMYMKSQGGGGGSGLSGMSGLLGMASKFM